MAVGGWMQYWRPWPLKIERIGLDMEVVKMRVDKEEGMIFTGFNSYQGHGTPMKKKTKLGRNPSTSDLVERHATKYRVISQRVGHKHSP